MLSVTTINITHMTTLNARFTQKGEPSSSGKVRRTTLKTTTMAKLSSSSSSVTIAKSSSSHNNNNENINSRQGQQFLINKGRRNTGALVVKASEGGEADISVVERSATSRLGNRATGNHPHSTAGRLVPEEGFNAARTCWDGWFVRRFTTFDLRFRGVFFLLTRDGSFCDHAHLRFPDFINRFRVEIRRVVAARMRVVRRRCERERRTSDRGVDAVEK